MANLTLHGFPMSPNTRRARFMLEELELPYAFENVDLMSGQQRSDAYKGLNPTARVPTLVDGDVTLWESNAILVYLAEKWPERRLAGDGPAERGEVARWMFMNAAHLSPSVARIFAHTIRLPEDQRLPRIVDESRADVARSLGALETQLAGKEHLCGRFTIADVSTVATLSAAPMLQIALGPAVTAWVARVTARPAWARSGA